MRSLAISILIELLCALVASGADEFAVVNLMPQFEVTNKTAQRPKPKPPEAAPMPRTCTNCTACGNACSCYGGGYYCDGTFGKCDPSRPITKPLKPVPPQEAPQHYGILDPKSGVITWHFGVPPAGLPRMRTNLKPGEQFPKGATPPQLPPCPNGKCPLAPPPGSTLYPYGKPADSDARPFAPCPAADSRPSTPGTGAPSAVTSRTPTSGRELTPGSTPNATATVHTPTAVLNAAQPGVTELTPEGALVTKWSDGSTLTKWPDGRTIWCPGGT